MGGFLGIGGKNSKQQNQSIGNLNNLYNFGMNSGSSSTSAGSSSLGAAGSYYSNLLSGSRTASQAAIAPEANQVRSAADASRTQQATMGTARGGGVAATNQQATDKTNATVDNALFSARAGAAQGEAAVGGEQAQQGLGLLNNASSSKSNAGSIATNARQQAASEQQSIIGDIFGFASRFA
jgi:hypothetical protein